MTPQYAGLRTLHANNSGTNFSVLGFPCNQCGAQEPGTTAEISEFARSKYDVNFPMFSKIDVNGDGACELYKILKAAQPNDDGSTKVTWNFTKFLVNANGEIVTRFSPRTTPEEIEEQLDALL